MEKTMIDINRLWTQKAYAESINKSPQLIYYWVRNGKLTTFKINGTILIYI